MTSEPDRLAATSQQPAASSQQPSSQQPQKWSKNIGFKAFTKIKRLWLENGVWGDRRSAATGGSIFVKWLWSTSCSFFEPGWEPANPTAVPPALKAPEPH